MCRMVLRAAMLAALALLPSCLTTALWEAPPNTREERTDAVFAAVAGDATSPPAVYLPAEILPEAWCAANPPLQPWLELRPQYVAEPLRSWFAGVAAASVHAEQCTITLGTAEFLGAMHAVLRTDAAGIDAWCNATWSVGPPEGAVVVGGTVRAFVAAKQTSWWRGLLTPFTFALDVVLSPIELAAGSLWPRC